MSIFTIFFYKILAKYSPKRTKLQFPLFQKYFEPPPPPPPPEMKSSILETATVL